MMNDNQYTPDWGLEDLTKEAMDSFLDQHRRAGCVTAVAVKDTIICQQASGLRDIETQTAMTLDTIFRIASLSKPITSVAALMLVDQGILELHSPLAHYLPEFSHADVLIAPEAKDLATCPLERSVLVKDLLCHTAGFTHGRFGRTPLDRLYRQQFNTPAPGSTLKDMAHNLSQLPLLYQPGQHWHYSIATDLLGYLVEVVSGQRFDLFLDEHLFGPLGMIDTGFYVPADKLHRFAKVYGATRQGRLRSVHPVTISDYGPSTSYFSGGAGLVSTVPDYMRFAMMLLNKGCYQGQRILKTETVQLMTQNHLTEAQLPIGFGPEPRQGVGFGLGVSSRIKSSSDEPDSVIGEYGWGGVVGTHWWSDPKANIAVVTMSQHWPYSDMLERWLKPVVYKGVEQ